MAMVIVIGTNGDRHNWRQWRLCAPLAPFDPSPLAPMDRHYALAAFFCRNWRKWHEFQIIMTLLPLCLYRTTTHLITE